MPHPPYDDAVPLSPFDDFEDSASGTVFDVEATTTNPNRPSLSIDWEIYAAMLEASDMPLDQQMELIETLWSIVVMFVDLGFDLNPVQQFCGEADAVLADEPADLVSLMDDGDNKDAALGMAQPLPKLSALDAERDVDQRGLARNTGHSGSAERHCDGAKTRSNTKAQKTQNKNNKEAS